VCIIGDWFLSVGVNFIDLVSKMKFDFYRIYAIYVISKAKPEKSLRTMLANGVLSDFSAFGLDMTFKRSIT